MKIKTGSFFFISGGVLFSLLIINQLYGYYQMSAVASQYGNNVTAEIKRAQDELVARNARGVTSSEEGATESLTPMPALSSFTPGSTPIQPADDNPRESESAKALNQQKAEIAHLKEQLREVERDHDVMKNAIVHCVSIEHMGDRLDCYDKMNQQQKKAGKQGGGHNRNWAIRKNISPIDDSASLSLAANARETFKSYGGDTIRPVFSVACDQENVTVMFSTGQYFPQGNYYFETRIGKNKSRPLSWRIDQKGRTAYLEMQKRDFIKELIVSDRLAIQIGSVKEPNSVLTFDLAGLSETNQELQKFCGVTI